MELSKWNPFKFKRNKPSEAKREAEEWPSEALSRPASPLSPLDAMQRLMAQSFWDPFLSGLQMPFGESLPANRWFGDFSPSVFEPRIDVVDEGKVLRMTAELPGMSQDDVKVTLGEGTLTVKGEKRTDASSTEDGCYRTERAYGYFHRVVPLPTDVDADGTEATFDKGVLTVRIAKTQGAKPEEKEIKIGAS